MKQKFKATMFVTLKYKDTNMDRDAENTKNFYLEQAKKNGIEIISCELVKENKKSGSHDGYATGNYYDIVGEIEARRTKELTRFSIYHNFRNDYWCVKPVLQSGIKFINQKI